MKNILKLSGIIVLVAVIGFSFAACSNGSTDDPATYTAAFFAIGDEDYKAAFSKGAIPSVFELLSGTRDDLIGQVTTALDDATGTSISGEGLPYAEVDGTIQELVDDDVITSNNKTTLMNELNSKGYVVGVIDDTSVVVMAAFKE